MYFLFFVCVLNVNERGLAQCKIIYICERKGKKKAEILTGNCMHGHACSFFLFSSRIRVNMIQDQCC